VICYFNPKVRYPIGLVTATSEQDTAHAAEQLIDGRIREVTYTSCGYTPLTIRGAHPGWYSSDLSDLNGDMATPQVIEIDYLQSIRSQNFFLVGLSTNYPVDFTLEISDDAATWQTLETVTGNTAYHYALRKPTKRIFRYVRFTITKIFAAEAAVKLLQAGAVTTVAFEFYDNDIMKLVEEMRQYNASPLSGVCSSYVEFALSNEDRMTDPDNASSLFRGLLASNFTFRPYIGLKLSELGEDDEFSFMPLGEFYCNIAEEKTEGITSYYVGYDAMSRIIDLTPPILTVQYDTTIYQLFKLLFDGLGLRLGKDYKIDKALSQKVPAGFFAGEMGSNFSGETVGELLNVLSEAGCCYVRCNRFGQVVVKSNFLAGDVDATLKDDDFVFSVQKSKDYNDYYEQVNIRYREQTGLENETELYRADMRIPLGGGPELYIEFPDPVGLITQVKLEGATNSSLLDFYPGATRAAITFSNAVAAETVTLIIRGKKLRFFNTHIEKTSVLPGEEDAKKILSVSNWLIQDRDVALSYGDSVLHFVSELFSKYAIIERGNPALEIGDKIRLYDATNVIDKNLQIVRRSLTWRGILSADTQCRIALSNWKWARVAPPHLIQCTITKSKIVHTSWIGPGLNIEKEMN